MVKKTNRLCDAIHLFRKHVDVFDVIELFHASIVLRTNSWVFFYLLVEFGNASRLIKIRPTYLISGNFFLVKLKI